MSTFPPRRRRWVALIGLAVACSVAVIVIACTVHNRCINSDPGCVFHSYTLLHTAGPGILAFVGAPVLLSVVVAGLLQKEAVRGSERTRDVVWVLAALSCVIGVVGLAVEGFLMLLAAVFTVGAVAMAPRGPAA